MKNLIKKFTLPATLLLAVFAFNSCIKERNAGATDFNMLQPFVQIPEGGGPKSGNFANQALSFSSADAVDSIQFYVNYASKTVAASDITVTLAYDAAALAAFNADTTNKIKYDPMPDSVHAPITTKVIVKAGNSYSAAVSFIVYPNKLDPAKSYMFPISITDAQGNNISKSFGTIYYHIIGNPLAGPYTSTGYFYHPSAPRAINKAKTLSAVDAITLLVELGDLGGSGYFAQLSVPDPYNTTTIQNVTITVAPGSISPLDIWGSGLPTSNPGYTAGWVGSAACNNTYDPATKTFYVRYGYTGGTGYRVTEEWIKHN